MDNNTKKSPADILLEKLNEIDKKHGLPPAKTGNKTGAVIYFPRKDDPLLNYLKNKKKKSR